LLETAVRSAAPHFSLCRHGVDAYSGQPAKMMETEEVGLRNVCVVALAAGGA
jgi:hypothetical protein